MNAVARPGSSAMLTGFDGSLRSRFSAWEKKKKNKAYGSDWAGLYTYHVPFVVAYRLGACK